MSHHIDDAAIRSALPLSLYLAQLTVGSFSAGLQTCSSSHWFLINLARKKILVPCPEFSSRIMGSVQDGDSPESWRLNPS